MLLHCVTKTPSPNSPTPLFFSLDSFVCIAHQRLSTGGLERLIYDVNHAVKGKANRKEHAQQPEKDIKLQPHLSFPHPLYLSTDNAGAGPPTPPPSSVYKDTGPSLSITANVVKGSFSGGLAASRAALTPPFCDVFSYGGGGFFVWKTAQKDKKQQQQQD